MRLDVVACGFIPLTDSAALVAAHEMGFAAEEGLELDLRREASWSSIRDRVALGAYPAAHMLSPMAIALSMGLGPVGTRVDAPFVLNLNGNTLTATAEVAAALRTHGANPPSARSVGAAFARLIAERPLRIGAPFPQSMHLLLTRYFLKSSGADLSRVDFTIAPPPVLAEVMRAGEVDVFMVGEPWGSVAVERGDAEILLPGAAIWRAAPEKVLGVRRDWADNNPEVLRRLIRALYRAAQWCAGHGSAGVLADILAMPRYLNQPSEVIERALNGYLVRDAGGAMCQDPDILRLGARHANFPWRSAAMWIADQAAEGWGVSRTEAIRVATECFRSDIYRQALAPLGVDLPAGSMKTEGALSVPTLARSASGETEIGPDSFFDGAIFPASA